MFRVLTVNHLPGLYRVVTARWPDSTTPGDTQRHSTTVQRANLGLWGARNCAKAPVRPELRSGDQDADDRALRRSLGGPNGLRKQGEN